MDRKITIPIGLSLIAFVLALTSPAPASDGAYGKLKATGDALRAQQREVQRSYNDIAGQIDELRRQQTLLEGYMTQLDHSIKDVDRAINELR